MCSQIEMGPSGKRGVNLRQSLHHVNNSVTEAVDGGCQTTLQGAPCVHICATAKHCGLRSVRGGHSPSCASATHCGFHSVRGEHDFFAAVCRRGAIGHRDRQCSPKLRATLVLWNAVIVHWCTLPEGVRGTLTRLPVLPLGRVIWWCLKCKPSLRKTIVHHQK